MDFHYDDWLPKESNVGYETLHYDMMIGDATLFMHADMVEEAWRVVQPVLAVVVGVPGRPAEMAAEVVAVLQERAR
jgi:glucose-6-phosphate 1-dehydrogenase